MEALFESWRKYACALCPLRAVSECLSQVAGCPLQPGLGRCLGWAGDGGRVQQLGNEPVFEPNDFSHLGFWNLDLQSLGRAATVLYACVIS